MFHQGKQINNGEDQKHFLIVMSSATDLVAFLAAIAPKQSASKRRRNPEVRLVEERSRARQWRALRKDGTGNKQARGPHLWREVKTNSSILTAEYPTDDDRWEIPAWVGHRGLEPGQLKFWIQVGKVGGTQSPLQRSDPVENQYRYN